VLEPVIATPEGLILNGCRRWQAAIELGLKQIPVRIVMGLDDAAKKELIIILNQHRKPLPSVMVREALAIARLDELSKGSGNGKKSSNGVNGHFPGISKQIVTRVGFSNKRAFERAYNVLVSGDKALIDLMDSHTIISAYRKLHTLEKRSAFSSIIKPSDNWNFSPVRYPRIDNGQAHGYIPGDIYANWYFVEPGDIVVDPMAGSGMARYVYNRRKEWMGEHVYDFKLKMFDLTPQTPYIKQHNILTGFQTKKDDYIFIDLPYLGMSKGVYSKKMDDLANMSEAKYNVALKNIAQACASAQQPGSLCTVLSPNYTDHQALRVINMVEFIRDCWNDAGYRLYLETYSSRRIQRAQNPTMAKLNNVAKECRLPLTDIAVVLTFERA
jgi:ParB family chromosome partitioning protein